MESLITPPANYRIRVYSEGGATLQRLLAMTKEIINSKPCELVYILGGICSITERKSGIVSLPFKSTDEIYQQTKDLFKAVITDLDNYDSTPVIFCQLVGVDLHAANLEPQLRARRLQKRGKRHPLQAFLNEAIIKLNEYIRLLNTERGNETPELASYIHKHHGQSGWKHTYSRLGDGVHPTPATRSFWAKRLEENIGLFVKKQE